MIQLYLTILCQKQLEVKNKLARIIWVFGYFNEKVGSKAANEVKSLRPPDIQGVPKKGGLANDTGYSVYFTANLN